ncbi:transcriptional regulator [Lasius niger]|uniref:Transcriptional regulator n=1 Tax=Lasius niger TaxID=67767 RepID=A0A0J7MT67_LASNI|nr:transcriptional regulator [Lasius niger]
MTLGCPDGRSASEEAADFSLLGRLMNGFAGCSVGCKVRQLGPDRQTDLVTAVSKSTMSPEKVILGLLLTNRKRHGDARGFFPFPEAAHGGREVLHRDVLRRRHH